MVVVAEVTDGKVGHRLGTVSPEPFHPLHQLVALMTIDKTRLGAVNQKDADAITAYQAPSLLRVQLGTAHVPLLPARVGPSPLGQEPWVRTFHALIIPVGDIERPGIGVTAARHDRTAATRHDRGMSGRLRSTLRPCP